MMSNSSARWAKEEKQYAVIRFEDDSVSEIPITWLCDNDRSCWWPRNTKMVASLINKYAMPEPDTWDKYAVTTVETICNSLDVARKKAQDISYSESEELNRGRGKRSLKKSVLLRGFNNSASSDSELDVRTKRMLTPPPELESDMANISEMPMVIIQNNDVIQINNQCEPDDVFSKEPSHSNSIKLAQIRYRPHRGPHSQDDNNQVLNQKRELPCSSKAIFVEEENGLQLDEHELHLPLPHPKRQGPISHILPRIQDNGANVSSGRNRGTLSSSTDWAQLQDNDQGNFNECNILLSQPESRAESIRHETIFHRSQHNEDDSNGARVLGRILEVVTEIKLQVNDIALNMEAYKLHKQPNKHLFEIFTKKLPLHDVEEMEEFENLLAEESKNNLFKKYLSTIGGNDYKDNITRIYKLIFTNEFGVGCSWLGQRNNVRVVDLKIIAAVKETIMGAHNVQQKLFENFSSEWFRHSRQRLQREKKL